MQGDFFLTTWFLEAMRWVYQNLESVFLTILVCTVILRALTVFSDIKTRKSSAQMALIQPDIDRIQKKYKNDPRKAQAEQSKLMKEKGVSMWGSCLPLLITMPLFFCFIAAFRFWGYEMTLRLLTDENSMDLFKSFSFLWINNIWQPDNGSMPVIQNAATFLSTADLSKLLFLQNNTDVWAKLVDMGIAVKTSVFDSSSGVWNVVYEIVNNEASQAAYTQAMQQFVDYYNGFNNGWFIMPVLAAGTNLLSSWQMQKSQPAPQKDGQKGMSGKLMMYMFPVMSFFICLTNSAAFAIYWALSSIIMILINIVLNKKYPRVAVQPTGDKK